MYIYLKYRIVFDVQQNHVCDCETKSRCLYMHGAAKDSNYGCLPPLFCVGAVAHKVNSSWVAISSAHLVLMITGLRY